MRSGKGYAPVAEKGMLTIWLAGIQSGERVPYQLAGVEAMC